MNKIALLNDAFRKTFSGGKVMMTSGVDELPDMVKATALQKGADFGEFSDDNDPYSEHDFGSFELVSRKFFWKIDYYDKRCEEALRRIGKESPINARRVRNYGVDVGDDPDKS